jgi:hypothetical protein
MEEEREKREGGGLGGWTGLLSRFYSLREGGAGRARSSL